MDRNTDRRESVPDLTNPLVVAEGRQGYCFVQGRGGHHDSVPEDMPTVPGVRFLGLVNDKQILAPILEEQRGSTKIALPHLKVARTAIKPTAGDMLS